MIRLFCFVMLLFVACGGEKSTELPSPGEEVTNELHTMYVQYCFDGTEAVSETSYKEALENCLVPPTCDPEHTAEVSSSEIRDFLSYFNYGEKYTVRWDEAPLLHIASNISQEQREVIHEAVFRLNEVLPAEYNLQFGEDIKPDAGAVPDGSIYIGFSDDRSTWKQVDGDPIVTVPARRLGSAGLKRNHDRDVVLAARIWIAPEAISGQICPRTNEYGRLLSTVTHELLHSLGLAGGHFRRGGLGLQSILTSPDACDRGDVFFPQTLDCAALQKIYEIPPGTRLDDID